MDDTSDKQTFGDLPTLAFNFKNGAAELFKNGEKQDSWLPVMFTNKSLNKAMLTEAGSSKDMIMVKVSSVTKLMEVLDLTSLIAEEVGSMEFRHKFNEQNAKNEGIKVAAYCTVKNDKLHSWNLFTSGAVKTRKTSVPHCWTAIGIHSKENTQIKFEVNPNNIIFLTNKTVSRWMTFDEMQLHFPKEIAPDQKAKLKFRWRLKISQESEVRLCIEMIVLTNNIKYENLPELKKRILESQGSMTMLFWSQRRPVECEGNSAECDILIAPTFGTFGSKIDLSDATVRRIVFDISQQLQAGKSTSKIEEMTKYLESKSNVFYTGHSKALSIPVPEGVEVNTANFSEVSSERSGKAVIIGNTVIRAKKGNKYQRDLKIDPQTTEILKASMPSEATAEDVVNMQKLLSHSIANTTACSHKSIKKRILQVCPERNVLRYPKNGDDALILTRLSQEKGLKTVTILYYMKVYRSLVVLEGATPWPPSLQYKQMIKGLRNRNHNPMEVVAKSHRKAYSVSSLRIVGHAIASSKWTDMKKQAVFTPMLLAFWGRLRLCEILNYSAFEFKRDNSFLFNDVKFMKDEEGRTEGVQLWIRHAKVPDDAGALVEIPNVDKFKDICPVRAMKKYIQLRKLHTKRADVPFFLDEKTSLMTKNKFSGYIKEALRNLEPEHQHLFEDLKGHSLRAGVPTAMQALSPDIDPQIMQYLGRWRGCSVNLYMKDKNAAASARLAVASAFNNNVE